MQIWVDADACPGVIKDILFRAAERLRISLALVANQPVRTPRSRYIKAILVSSGFDVADQHIVEEVQTGDLVITADIPLAAAVIEKGGHALNPRGELYTQDNTGAAESAEFCGRATRHRHSHRRPRATQCERPQGLC
jgi:uncharacterized protein YaiI (UPF0178 family)